MKKQSPIPIVVGVALVVGVAGFILFGRAPQKALPTRESTPGPSPTASPVSEADANPILPPDKVTPQKTEENPETAMIYGVVTDEKGSHLEPKPTTLPKGNAIIAAALNLMAEEPNSPLPKGTVANSATVGADGQATVDFNKAFKENFSGGDEKEALTINAITATVGQFPGVKTVLITLEGEKMDTLGGTKSLDEPLPIPQEEGAKTAHAQ